LHCCLPHSCSFHTCGFPHLCHSVWFRFCWLQFDPAADSGSLRRLVHRMLLFPSCWVDSDYILYFVIVIPTKRRREERKRYTFHAGTTLTLPLIPTYLPTRGLDVDRTVGVWFHPTVVVPQLLELDCSRYVTGIHAGS